MDILENILVILYKELVLLYLIKMHLCSEFLQAKD